MSTLSQFAGGNLPPKNIVNACSTTGYTAIGRVDIGAATSACKTVNSGALTANTLATVLSITGSGIVEFLAAWALDTTSRTIRMQVTIDGTVVFDSTSAAIATYGNGGVVVGGVNSAASTLSQMPFRTSLLVKVASSLTETDKTSIGYKYWTA